MVISTHMTIMDNLDVDNDFPSGFPVQQCKLRWDCLGGVGWFTAIWLESILYYFVLLLNSNKTNLFLYIAL